MIKITPTNLAKIYEALKSFRPYEKMGLPGVEEVKFVVMRKRDVLGEYWYDNKKKLHMIAVSTNRVYTMDFLTQVVGHEMLHLYQKIAGTGGYGHNEEFKALSKKVCKAMGWDLGWFHC